MSEPESAKKTPKADTAPAADALAARLSDLRRPTLASAAAAGREEQTEARRRLHRFHLRPAAETATPGDDFLPAALYGLWRAQAQDEEPPASGEPPLRLLAAAAASRLEPAWEAFRDEARRLVTRGRALLEADHRNRPESREPGPVGDALGNLGSHFFDSSALAGVLDERPGGTVLPPARRRRLEEAVAALAESVAAEGPPALYLVHDGDSDPEPDLEGWRVERRPDPCAGAAELFDREAESLTRLRRAARRIRLETAGDFDSERHEPWLESLDWQALSREELALLPPVVALASGEKIAGGGMVSLSRLLRSGRPVQVLLTVAPASSPGAEAADGGGEPFSEFRFEPAYLGLSHREAVVQQGSPAWPEHLGQGFDRAVAATHSALHVIAAGDAADRVYHRAAIAGRAHPLLSYDPAAGATWAERFDCSPNPQAEEDWPLFTLEIRGGKGETETLEVAFTFADFALLEPACRSHFLPLPPAVAAEEILPLAEYCRQPPAQGDWRIPYIWAVDRRGELCRLAVSRPLAVACRDRLGFWRTLQELAGVRSEYARRAAAAARQEMAARSEEEIAALRAGHAGELERLRREAVEDVVGRLTAAILDYEPIPAPAPLAAYAGRDVDQVATELLRLVDPATLDQPAAGSGDQRVTEVASELGRLAGA